MTLGKLYSAVFDKFKARIFKLYAYGPVTAAQVAPYGDDSNPVQGMDVIYASTDNDAEPIAIGFINTGLMAAPGEKRFFSQKADGSISFYTWMKSNGTYEIGGDTHNLVRYEPLNTAEQSLIEKINAELIKIQAGLSGVGGTYARAPVSIDISGAKINEIKTL